MFSSSIFLICPERNVSRETSAFLGRRGSSDGGVILPRQETICTHITERDDGKNDQQHHTDSKQHRQDTDASLQRLQLFLRCSLAPAAGVNLLCSGRTPTGRKLNGSTGLDRVLRHLHKTVVAENLPFFNLTAALQTIHISHLRINDSNIVHHFSLFVKRKVNQETEEFRNRFWKKSRLSQTSGNGRKKASGVELRRRMIDLIISRIPRPWFPG